MMENQQNTVELVKDIKKGKKYSWLNEGNKEIIEIFSLSHRTRNTAFLLAYNVKLLDEFDLNKNNLQKESFFYELYNAIFSYNNKRAINLVKSFYETLDTNDKILVNVMFEDMEKGYQIIDIPQKRIEQFVELNKLWKNLGYPKIEIENILR